MDFTCENFTLSRDSTPLTRTYAGSLIPLAVWNVVETNVGVVLACLPSMRPLLRILMGQKLERKPVDASELRRLDVKGSCSSSE